METHDLTEKELKALDNAVATIKKFKKYIQNVNCDNYWLRKNLDESIKVGDVTNAQKVDLMAANDARKRFEESLSSLKEECANGNCPISLDHTKNCPDSCELKQKLIVLDWMRGASRGNSTEWEWILHYALNGRKLWVNKYHHLDMEITP